MPTPNISVGQIAVDPTNKIFYFKKLNGELVSTTLDFLQNGNTEIVTSDNVTITASLTVDGNLTVNGTTTTINAETVLIEDNIIVLNSNVSATPSTNAGIEIERGTEANVQIRWNESAGKWQYTNDGTTYLDISSIIEDSVILGTHTTGNYISQVSAGTGVSISHTPGEGSTPSFSIGQSVGTTDNVIFNNVTSALTGNVTGTVSDISNHGISDLSDVTITDAVSGDFLRYSGSAWINDPVNLTTDTVGDYVSHLAAGTGITITNNSGEGSTPNISFSGSIDDISDIQITSAINGQTLIYNGTNWVNTTFPSGEPIGFENRTDSVISFDKNTRRFTIAPASTSYTVWCAGKRYVKTSSEQTTLPPTQSGLYYYYFDSSGQLGHKTTYFTWDQDTPVAYVYWNNTDGEAYFFADERHGVTLDWATHEYLHRTRGAAIANGFGANSYTLVGDGSSDAHAQIDIANGTFFDEDLQVDITHSASPTANTWEQRLQGGAYIPVFYKSNTEWKKDTATQFPVKNGGTRAQYNLNSAGTWSATAIDNSKYGVMFIVATNNLNEPVLSIMGQAQYTDQGSAEASTWDELDLDGFPVVEFRPLYKIVFQTATAYTNTVKTKFVNLLDLRQVISSGAGGSATAVSDHGSLTGLSDDDHTQYFNSSRHDAHDHTTALASASLNDLGDVTITSATPNQGLIWDGSAWVNQSIPLNLDGLSDVIITSATPNQVLKYDGTNWINAAAPGGSFAGTSYDTIVGDGASSTFVINHGLSTRNLVVSVNENVSPYSNIQVTWEATTLNSITVYFASPPSSNSIAISVYGAVSGTSTGNVNSYAETIGDGSNLTYVITHNLSSRDIILQARNANSPYESYNVAWEATTINTATVYFDSAPASNTVRIKVIV